MLSFSSHTRIFFATAPTDMRKGFNGLQGAVTSVLKQDPLSGHLFLFVNRRRALVFSKALSSVFVLQCGNAGRPLSSDG